MTSNRKVDTCFRTHVHWIATVVLTQFSFFNVKLYRYQNISKSIPATIVSRLGKTILMPNYWPSRSVLRWMSVVWNREIRNMVLLRTFGLLLTCFYFGCFVSLYDVCIIGKPYVLFICIHKRIKSIVFAVSIKFCDESGL